MEALKKEEIYTIDECPAICTMKYIILLRIIRGNVKLWRRPLPYF